MARVVGQPGSGVVIATVSQSGTGMAVAKPKAGAKPKAEAPARSAPAPGLPAANPFLVNWLIALRRLGKRDFVVFALDPPLHEWMTAHGPHLIH